MTDNNTQRCGPIIARSKRNQYDFYIEEVKPLYRYMKGIMGGVVGRRLDPNTNSPIDFLLQTDDKDVEVNTYDDKGYVDPDLASYWRFNAANEIIDLYSEHEHRYFLRENKALLENGTLVEYDGREDGHVETLYLNRIRKEEEERLKREESAEKKAAEEKYRQTGYR